MIETISFSVLGTPEPQGSMKAFMVKGKPCLTSANADMKPWRQQVGWCALEARAKAGRYEPYPKGIALLVHCVFFLPRPKSVPKSRVYPTVKPDTDKLQRSIGDACTGVLWTDDSQIVDWHATKLYGNPARAEIKVEVIS